MVSPSSGILDADSWDEAESDFGSESPSQGKWQVWKPAATVRKTTPPARWVKFWLWQQPASRPKALHPTAYLDGLRGFAALLVYWHHHEHWVRDIPGMGFGILDNGFGYNGNYYLALLPGLRILVGGGHYAVTTFFVLSGYVLSIKPHRLIEQGDMAGLAEHLASAFFRRWLRLFLPLFVVIFFYATSWHLFGIWVHGAKPQSNWLDEMWWVYCELKNFSFLYDSGSEPWLSYNFHVWSIPVEMKGSLIIFGAHIAFSRCTLTARLWCQVALVVYFLYIADGWYCAMFVAGMLLSHLDLLAKMKQLPRFLVRFKPYKTFIYYHLLVFSIFLGGVPGQNPDVNLLAKNRGWYYLSYLKPQAVFDYKWFYLFWAAVFLVASIRHISWLKRFFETSVCQYLGRISYALYLIHGPVLWTVGDRLYLATGWKRPAQMEHIPHWADKLKLPSAGPFCLEVSFLLPHIILLPATLCLADLVTRMVDQPAVRFAGWLYRKTLPNGPSKCVIN